MASGGFYSGPNAMKCKSIAVPLLLVSGNEAGLSTTATQLVYPKHKNILKVQEKMLHTGDTDFLDMCR